LPKQEIKEKKSRQIDWCYSTYCCSLTNFWLELLEVCRRAGFCFVFSKKTREIK